MEFSQLRHPRIRIFHVWERTSDAERVASLYSTLGADVATELISGNRLGRRPRSRILYFKQEQRGVKIAKIMAANLAGTESLRIEYSPERSESIDFAIYFVTVRRTEGLRSKSTGQKKESKLVRADLIAPPSSTGLIECPQCPSSVRKDRISKHLARVHNYPSKNTTTAQKETRPFRKVTGTAGRNRQIISERRSKKKPRTTASLLPKKSKIVFDNDSTTSSMPHGPLFGAPKLRAFETPNVKSLKPKSETRRCSQCNRPAMYNDSACYLHNPK